MPPPPAEGEGLNSNSPQSSFPSNSDSSTKTTPSTATERAVHGWAPDAPLPPASGQSARTITWRSIILGFLLLPGFDYWVLDMEVRTSSVEPTDLTLVAPVVVVLFLLVGLNGLFRRWLPQLAFSPAELLVVYSILMLRSEERRVGKEGRSRWSAYP